LIKSENLTKSYDNKINVLNNISFNIEQGEVCGYLGANGAGKSTTIKILCGILAQSSGNVYINGINVLENPIAVKKSIGYIPESGALFLSLSALDYLEFVSVMYDIPKNVYIQRIYDLAELFDLKDEINTPMHSYSKGMRQKVLLIASLIHNPDVLIWDEPLTGLDYTTTQTIRRLVKELSQNGKTFFYSTHIIESVEKLCSRVIILNKGEIAYDNKINSESSSEIEKLMEYYNPAEDSESKKIINIYNNSK
jgi:ABC-2 type transport system ATP-binding protein